MKEKASASATANGRGIGFCGLLTILFIALKLLGVIDWSWIWVLAPLWISALLTITILVGVLAIVVIAHLID